MDEKRDILDCIQREKEGGRGQRCIEKETYQ